MSTKLRPYIVSVKGEVGTVPIKGGVLSLEDEDVTFEVTRVREVEV